MSWRNLSGDTNYSKQHLPDVYVILLGAHLIILACILFLFLYLFAFTILTFYAQDWAHGITQHDFCHIQHLLFESTVLLTLFLKWSHQPPFKQGVFLKNRYLIGSEWAPSYVFTFWEGMLLSKTIIGHNLLHHHRPAATIFIHLYTHVLSKHWHFIDNSALRQCHNVSQQFIYIL